jgi:hypothetical protein
MTMTTNKHTPGPWKVVDDPAFGAYLTIETEDGRLICDLGDSDVSADEDAANARLIAASPHMYDALVALYEQVATAHAADPDWSIVLDEARAAIAAADGPLGKPKEDDDDDAV